MDLLCGTCGHHNPPDRHFCLACNSYLGPDAELVPSKEEEEQASHADALVDAEADAGFGGAVQRGAEPPVHQAAAVASDVACPQCGTTNPAGQRFCRKCGEVLLQDVTRAPVGARQAPAEGTTSRSPSAAGAARLTTVSCPRCGTANRPELRFCRKCGEVLSEPGAAPAAFTPQAQASRTGWWQRLLGQRPTGASSAARKAYRGSLPARYRPTRLVATGVVVVAVAAVLVWRGSVGWVQGVYWDLLNKTVAVDSASITATADPTAPKTPGHGPRAAVDGDLATYWVTPWSSALERTVTRTAPSCGQTPPGTESLVLSLPSVRLRGIEVATGLPDPTLRGQHWRPKTLRVMTAPGQCQDLTLDPGDQLQTFELHHATTQTVTLTIIDAYSPPSGQVPDTVEIREVTLLRRPG